jgi:hypothetical protein
MKELSEHADTIENKNKPAILKLQELNKTLTGGNRHEW